MKLKILAFSLLSIIVLVSGYLFFHRPQLNNPRKLCKNTGGEIVGCAKALFDGCSTDFFEINGEEYACACEKEKKWDNKYGCK